MSPLHKDPHYTFRFRDERLVPRFHLDGIEPGRRVAVYRLDPDTGTWLVRLAEAVAGDGGWVDLPEPLMVRAGDGFVAVPEVGIVVRWETPADQSAVREVVRAAFGRDEEADLVDALRAGGFTRLSLVAEQDGAIVGHVLFTRLPVETPGGVFETLALAPVSVLPEWQRRNVGSRLIRGGLAACRDRGHRAVIVLGHPDYYPRFGFSAAAASRLKSPFPGPHFMALELVPGALAGVEGEVRYPAPFGVG